MAKTYILEPDEFSDHPRNDLEGIDNLLDDILGLKESDDDEVPTPEPEPEPDEGGSQPK